MTQLYIVMYDNANLLELTMYPTLNQAKEELEMEYLATPDFKSYDYRIEVFRIRDDGCVVHSGDSVWRVPGRLGDPPSYRVRSDPKKP